MKKIKIKIKIREFMRVLIIDLTFFNKFFFSKINNE